jgi:hypothetical protein
MILNLVKAIGFQIPLTGSEIQRRPDTFCCVVFVETLLESHGPSG